MRMSELCDGRAVRWRNTEMRNIVVHEGDHKQFGILKAIECVWRKKQSEELSR